VIIVSMDGIADMNVETGSATAGETTVITYKMR
jgi:hypothetical protein